MDALNVQALYATLGDRALMLDHFRNKDILRDYAVDLKRKNRKIFHAIISLIRQSHGGEYIILTVVQDITEQ